VKDLSDVYKKYVKNQSTATGKALKAVTGDRKAFASKGITFLLRPVSKPRENPHTGNIGLVVSSLGS
jgi:hypothetical protein